MVLRAALLALVLSGCVTGQPARRAPSPTPIAVAFVLDREETTLVEGVPANVEERAKASLSLRNLVPQSIASTVWGKPFESQRRSTHRLTRLAADTAGPDLLLLVETKASFYSLLNGRYRWTVHVHATLARRGALEDAISDDFDFPAFLDFDHLKETAALNAVAPTIADRIGQLADAFLAIPVAEAKSAPRPESMYFVLVDRFQNGDPSNDGAIDLADPEAFHGGDLQGVYDRIGYLEALGVTTVWLSPVFRMRTEKLNGHGAFHGYWVSDFGEIEPRFGTSALLRKVSDELHRRGMKLLLDVVLNHVGYDTPLVASKPGWFHAAGDIEDWNDRTEVETHDVHGLPDLAQENPEVYEYLLATSKKWIDEIRPDGFRLDAVKHVPLTFWAKYNDAIRAHAGPDFFLLGEDLDGDPRRLATTLRDGRFSSVFDFPLHFALIDVICKGAPRARLESVLWQDALYDHPERLVTLLDNHDLPRLASVCETPDARALAETTLLSMRGIPCLSYGTETQSKGLREPDNRADMKFVSQPQNLFRPPTRRTSLVRDGATRTVRLSIAEVPAKTGDRVFAVGSAELGAWSPQAGVELARIDDAHFASDVTRPAAAVYEYKFAVLRADATVVWEDRANRYLTMRSATGGVRHWGSATELD